MGEVDTGPGVLGSSPGAGSALYPEVVDPSLQPEEPVLPPVGSPRVPHHPELLPVLLSVPDHGDVVVYLSGVGDVGKDAARVLEQLVRGADPAGDGSAVEDLRHHGQLLVLPGHVAVLLHGVGEEPLGAGAAGLRPAGLAGGDGGARHTVVVSPRHVDAARLVGDPVLVDPLVGGPGVPPVAAVHRTAGDQHLDREQ